MTNFERMQVFSYLDGAADGLKEARNDIIEELEKIKEEVEELGCLRDNPYNNETEYSVSTEELRELINKHIKELKGEQK